MIVLGIDPGVANTGYGVVAHQRGRLVALDGGVIETRAGTDAGLRLAHIHARVRRADGRATSPTRSPSRISTSAPTRARRSPSARPAASSSSPPASARSAARSYTPQQVKTAVMRLRPGREGPGPADGPDALVADRSCRSPTTRPTRSRSRSATPTARRWQAALARVVRMIALDHGRSRGPPRRPCRRLLRRRRLPPAVSAETLSHVPRIGEPASLFTHLIVRDDALLLYGFATEQERDLFLLLLGVQSVGPKMALAVLSGGTPRELLAAVAGGDTARLQSVPGHRQAHRGADRRRAQDEGRRRPPPTIRSSSRGPTSRTPWRARA